MEVLLDDGLRQTCQPPLLIATPIAKDSVNSERLPYGCYLWLECE